MAGKTRVHQLAKELGVTSKELLVQLNDAGESVKSASSTLTAPVARRLRETYATKGPHPNNAGVTRKPSTAVTARQRPHATTRRASRRGHLTTSEAESIGERYRLAAASEKPNQAITRLYLEYRAAYGISRATWRQIIDADRRRNPGKYPPLRNLRKAPRDHPNKARPQKPDKTRTAGAALAACARGSAWRPPDLEKGVTARPRIRTASLPPTAAMPNLDTAADIIVGKNASSADKEAVVSCLQDLVPKQADGYGYLTWRYTVMHRAAHAEVRSTTAQHDLSTLTGVVDQDKKLLDTLVHVHGAILERPGLAIGAMDDEYRDLTDSDDIGRSAADELRRARDKLGFLRRAVMLTIANPDNNDRLWDMLDRIQPPTPDQLVETTPELEATTHRLSELIAAVDRLFTTDEATLDRFFRKSRSELVALQAGRYDFLRAFRDTAAGSSTASGRTVTDLAFEILPQGEQLRVVLDGIRSAGLYRGYEVDEKRVTVLQDLQTHFGVDRCRLYAGPESSSGVNSRYLVLAIKSANGSGEHAVAISPLAGRDATYVVRRDCVEEDWTTIFATAKAEARVRGARKLLFTSTDRHADPYIAMCAKVVHLLECPPREFRKRSAAEL